MKYAILLTLLGLTQFALAATVAPAPGAWLLYWAGLIWTLAGCAYAAKGGSRIFGKRTNGGMAWANVALMFPYLGPTWLLWHVQRLLSREPPHQEIAPGLWLGRRCSARKLPPGTVVVVDLTSEFCELAPTRAGREYLCLPTLDASVPSDRAFSGLVRAIAHAVRAGKPVYIHCAKGYGRSATVMAAVLVAMGHVASLEHAHAQMQRARPGIKINRIQRNLLERWDTAHRA